MLLFGHSFPQQLTNKRKVSVRQFKGKTMVDIREYYEDSNGDIKPGRKGGHHVAIISCALMGPLP